MKITSRLFLLLGLLPSTMRAFRTLSTTGVTGQKCKESKDGSIKLENNSGKFRDYNPHLQLSGSDGKGSDPDPDGNEKRKERRDINTITAVSETIPSKGEVWSAIALVTGTTVGAGILALPKLAAPSGFLPSSLALTGSWVFMATTGLLIAEVVINLVRENRKEYEGIGLLAICNKVLGIKGSVVAGSVYILIHYALLVAYIAGAGDILTNALGFPQWGGPLLFAFSVGGLMALGSEALTERFNNFFVLLVGASFLGLLCVGARSMDFVKLFQYNNYSRVLPAIPVMLLALVYHNVVPTVCQQLRYHSESITRAITVGSAIPLAMFILWNAVILGMNGGSSSSGGDGAPVVGALQSGALTDGLIAVFSESAIITSFVGFVYGLLSFYDDLNLRPSRRDPLLYGLILLPPTALALAAPTLFMPALDFAGTYGITVLFGAIPVLLAKVLRGSRGGASGKGQYEMLVPGGDFSLAVLLLLVTAVIGLKTLSPPA